MAPPTALRETAKGVIIVDGDGEAVSFTSGTPVPIVDGWRVNLYADEGLNNTDKIINVPAGVEWQVLWIWVELTTNATAGNRQMVVEIQDSAGDVIANLARAGVVQAASLAYNYLFAAAVADLTAVRDSNYLTTPLPPTSFLKAGDKIRIRDNAAIDPDDDDMIIQIQYAERSI